MAPIYNSVDEVSDDSKCFSNDLSKQKLSNDLDTKELKSIEQSIKDYAIKYKPALCLLTPCYGGLCHVQYTICLIETIKFFNYFSIPLQIEFCKNDSLISRARNNLVAKAMNRPQTTHIMFIDNDISWNPIDVLKLMIDDKNLIGGVYPLKKYEWKNCLDINKELIDSKNDSYLKDIVSDDDTIRSKMLKFNVNFLDNSFQVENNLGKVRHIATGFMMMKRCVIENMCLAHPSTKYTDDVGFLTEDENNFAFALFDCGVEDGHYLSEDWMFCHRWRKMNEDVYIDISINLIHTGMEDYSGSLLTSFFTK